MQWFQRQWTDDVGMTRSSNSSSGGASIGQPLLMHIHELGHRIRGHELSLLDDDRSLAACHTMTTSQCHRVSSQWNPNPSEELLLCNQTTPAASVTQSPLNAVQSQHGHLSIGLWWQIDNSCRCHDIASNYRNISLCTLLLANWLTDM